LHVSSLVSSSAVYIYSLTPSVLHSTIRRRPSLTLFPYTTLFRSHVPQRIGGERAQAPHALADVHGPPVRVHVAHPDDHERLRGRDRKSTRLNSSHVKISYAVFCLKKKKHNHRIQLTHQLAHTDQR